MVDAVAAFAGPEPRVLDLGCGPGSLSARVLDRIPGASVVAIDADPVLLAIGRGALGEGRQLEFIDADLRTDWVSRLPSPGPYDAAVSTTALHWLRLEQLIHLYHALASGPPPRRGVPRWRPARLRPRSARDRGGSARGAGRVARCPRGCRGLRRVVGGRRRRARTSRLRSRSANGAGTRIPTRTRPTATSSTGPRCSPPDSSRWERCGSTLPIASWWRSADGSGPTPTGDARAHRPVSITLHKYHPEGAWQRRRDRCTLRHVWG